MAKIIAEITEDGTIFVNNEGTGKELAVLAGAIAGAVALRSFKSIPFDVVLGIIMVMAKNVPKADSELIDLTTLDNIVRGGADNG